MFSDQPDYSPYDPLLLELCTPVPYNPAQESSQHIKEAELACAIAREVSD